MAVAKQHGGQADPDDASMVPASAANAHTCPTSTAMSSV
jgi:hypothetical protein